MAFIAAESFSQSGDAELSVLVNRGLLLLEQGKSWFPVETRSIPGTLNVVDRLPMGFLNGKRCELVFVDMDESKPPLPDTEWVGLRSLLGSVNDELFQVAGRGAQLCRWIDEHKYCGRCGSATRKAKSDRSYVCTACELRFYPKISPCVMVLVIRGDECLLASGIKHRQGLYSALAGFVEAGETAEQAAEREIMEESSIKFKNLRYFDSQPWPFPGQLMLAYFADYESGEIIIEDDEIVDAQWFRYDKLPTIPPTSTISGRLISSFVESCKSHRNLDNV